MFRSQDPGKRKKTVTWTFDRCLDGKLRKGWIAGPCVWVEVHAIGRSFPCLPLITDGQLVCVIDHAKFPLMLLGYQPLYNEQNKPTLIGLMETAYDQVQKFKLHQPVMWGKGEGKYGVVSLLPRTEKDPFVTVLDERKVAADCWPGLVTLWKDPALKELFDLVYVGPSCTRPIRATPGAPVIDESDPDVIALRQKMAEAKAKPAGELTVDDAVLANRTIDFVTGNVKAAEALRNGKHRKKT